jgi:molybdopterin adenylyltransferase
MSKPVIGVLNVSDRASAGVYTDEPGQACVALLREWLATEFDVDYHVVPDEVHVIAGELTRQADIAGCCLIVTTGGTGPAPRDVTPEATLQVVQRESSKSIRENLEVVFPAIPYCIDLIGGPRLETNDAVMKAFRPKGA